MSDDFIAFVLDLLSKKGAVFEVADFEEIARGKRARSSLRWARQLKKEEKDKLIFIRAEQLSFHDEKRYRDNVESKGRIQAIFYAWPNEPYWICHEISFTEAYNLFLEGKTWDLLD